MVKNFEIQHSPKHECEFCKKKNVQGYNKCEMNERCVVFIFLTAISKFYNKLLNLKVLFC